MKHLIICDTLFQIIVSIQLCLTIFKNHETDIWITDHTKGTDKIAERLSGLKLVRNVQYINTKHIDYSDNIFTSIKNAYDIGIKNRELIPLDDYDEVLFYSITLITYNIYNAYRLRKHNTVFSRFEEGVFSYDTDFNFGRNVRFVEKYNGFLGREPISKVIQNYYCFIPELKKESNGWNLIKIPSIGKNLEQLKSILVKVFEYKGFDYPQKYIFFASSSDIDGKGYGETDIIIKLAETIGKDNFLVKIHPRDNRDIYSVNGITTMHPTGIPWEVFQMCEDMTDRVLLTVDSGSFISCSAVLNSNVRGLFLFDCINSRERKYYDNKEASIRRIINNLHDNGKCKGIRIIDNLDEIWSSTNN